MYVNPFWLGVICTLLVCAVSLIVLALYFGRKK